MIKFIGKILLLLIFLVLVAYGILIVAGGGFGKKAPASMTIPPSNQGLLFAHRGVVTGISENSRESIAMAKKLGFKGVEIDIRKSADNDFILFHDEDCSRLLGVNANVADLTTNQIKKFNLLVNGDTTASTVVTLKEMMDEFRSDFVFYFDMKLKNFNDADELVYFIETYDISKKVILASTSAPMIFYLEYHYPAINTALEGFDSGKEWMYFFIPKNLKPDFLSGFASKVDEKHVSWLKEKELLSSRIVYGVDSTNYQAMQDLGLRNMIIDFFPGQVVP